MRFVDDDKLFFNLLESRHSLHKIIIKLDTFGENQIKVLWSLNSFKAKSVGVASRRDFILFLWFV